MWCLVLLFGSPMAHPCLNKLDRDSLRVDPAVLALFFTIMVMGAEGDWRIVAHSVGSEAPRGCLCCVSVDVLIELILGCSCVARCHLTIDHDSRKEAATGVS